MKQCALIIGNNAYPGAILKNAVNDASDISIKLKGLGFNCIIATDASYKEMDVKLSEFSNLLSLHEVGVFFFAGHGMQIEGHNYLAAIDTNCESEIDAKHSSLELNKVIEKMEAAGRRTNIIILDACRNNPFERRWRSSGPRGLAPVYAPKGMIVGYATSPGQVASDGNGRNGAYTEAILSHISHQDLSIETFFKRVRNTLSSSTSGKQISWEHTSLMGDYFFNSSLDTTSTVTAYSEEALADRTYQPRGPLCEIIQALKSCDWHQQNPAMAQLSPSVLESAGKDDCFVLGRNIYQTSCSSSFRASYMENLAGSLLPYSEFAKLHIVNGMLYEIYFNSQGLKRKCGKAARLDEVFSLEENPIYLGSFDFIRNALLSYTDELFYLPGSRSEVCVDVVMEKFHAQAAVAKVCFQGQNILYNWSDDGYYDLATQSPGIIATRITLRGMLSEALVTPQSRLKVNYTGVHVAEGQFGAPAPFNLQRIAIK